MYKAIGVFTVSRTRQYVRPGAVLTDLTPSEVEWLLERKLIEPVEQGKAKPKSKPRTTKKEG